MSAVAPTDARLEKASLRLSALSAAKCSSNPFRLFTWPPAPDGDRRAMSDALSPSRGLPILETLSDEQRWRLSLLETVNFFSLNISGERELMAGIALRLFRGRPAHVSHYLQHFLEEENAHTAIFARFCLDYSGTVYPDRQLRFPREFLAGEEEFLFFARVLVFEEIAHFYNRGIAADDDVWMLARAINRYHAEDETRHIAFGRMLLDEMWERYASGWSAADRARILEYLERYVATVLGSYVNPLVYRALGLPAETRTEILESAHWKALAEASTKRVTQWLTRFGGASHA